MATPTTRFVQYLIEGRRVIHRLEYQTRAAPGRSGPALAIMNRDKPTQRGGGTNSRLACCLALKGRTMTLDSKRILIVEDEGIIAADLAMQVEAAGGKVVGTVATVDAALDIIASTELDGATVDI